MKTETSNGGDAMETETSNGDGGGRGMCLSTFVEEGSVESHRYYLARRTLLQMLRDRGYVVSDSLIELTVRQFRDLHGQHIDVDRLRFCVSHASNSEDRVLVVFFRTGMVRKNDMYRVNSFAFHSLNKLSCSLIMVLQGHLTHPAMRFVESFSYKVEMFQITDLLFNITRDVMNEKQLPRMSQKDSIAQNHPPEKGQVNENTIQQSFLQTRTFNKSQPIPDPEPIPDSQPIHDSEPIPNRQPPNPYSESQPIPITQPPKPFPESQPIPDIQPPVFKSMPAKQPVPPKKYVKHKKIKRKGKRPVTRTTPIVVPPSPKRVSPEEEEETLARAWFLASKNPIGQKFEPFWKRVTLQFLWMMGKGEYRTQDQLRAKFHEMLKRTAKFCRIYDNFLTNRKGDWTDSDILSKAREQYRTDEGTSFTHFSVWQLVIDDPKLSTLFELIEKVGEGSKRSKTSEDNDYVSNGLDPRTNIDLNAEENDDPIISQVEPTHSMERDKAKKDTEGGLSSSSSIDNMLAEKLDFFNTNYFEIQKQKLELKKRMLDEKVKAKDWKILTGDTSNLPEHIRIAAEVLRGKVAKNYNPNI